MKKEDARNLPAAAKQEKRKYAERLVNVERYMRNSRIGCIQEREEIRWIRSYEDSSAKALDAKVIKAWLTEHIDETEVFYLPAYIPEINPDDCLNCDLKHGVHSEKTAGPRGN